MGGACKRRQARCWSSRASRQHDLLVVLKVSLETGLPGMRGEEPVTVLLPGDFAGEMSTLRGVPGFIRIRVRDPGEVLAIREEVLRNLVQTDAEISEIMMRAFILRRMGLVASGQSEATLLGSRHSAGTLRLREFLTRNNYPYVSVACHATRLRCERRPYSLELSDGRVVQASTVIIATRAKCRKTDWPGYSQWAMCDPAASSASRPQWAKVDLRAVRAPRIAGTVGARAADGRRVAAEERDKAKEEAKSRAA